MLHCSRILWPTTEYPGKLKLVYHFFGDGQALWGSSVINSGNTHNAPGPWSKRVRGLERAEALDI